MIKLVFYKLRYFIVLKLKYSVKNHYNKKHQNGGFHVALKETFKETA